MADSRQSGTRKKSSSSGTRNSSSTRNSGARSQSGRTSNSRTAPKTNNTQRRKNNGSRNINNSNSKAASEESEFSMKDEMIVIGLVALAIFLFLCTIKVISSGDIDKPNLGDYVRFFMTGMFGITAYIVPFAGFLAVVLGISNRYNPKVYYKIGAGVVLLAVIGILAHIICYPDIVEVGKSGHWGKLFYTGAREGKIGGGIIFGAITVGLTSLMGKIGTIFLSVVLTIVAFVVLTGKSLVNFIKRISEEAYERSQDEELKEERAERRRERREARMEESSKRMDRRERGVTFNTFIKPNRPVNPPETENPDVTPSATNGNNLHTVISSEPEHTSEERFNTPIVESNISPVVPPVVPPVSAPPVEAIATVVPDIEVSTENVIGEPEVESNDIHRVIADFDPIETVGEDDWIKPVNVAEQTEYTGLKQEENENPEAYEDDEVNGFDNSEQDLPFSDDDSQETDFVPAGMAEVTIPDDNEVIEVDAENEIKKPVARLRSRDKSSVDFSQAKEIEKPKPPKVYKFPPVGLLNKIDHTANNNNSASLQETARRLEETLETFGVKVKVTDYSQGPAVTRYELHPEQGVKVSKILSLSDDIKLNLAAADIRIEAPIPGKMAVGIEVPNQKSTAVPFRELLERNEFKDFNSNLTFAVGKDIGGQPVIADISKMPHVLIAGATGSGKSVCINTLIMSILYKAHPDDVKMIMIDPKVVELSMYNGLPHMMIPVVTDAKKASAALQWGVKEMESRYSKFADMGCRDLKGYNQKVLQMKDTPEGANLTKLPQIVIIVDELADLMMVASKEVEESICRLAQLARAAGIHLVIATQRPSVDVITGIIKANMPSRIAFSVASGVDSRTILDTNGAEKLLGKGDMLFFPQGYTKPARVQGAFVTDEEVLAVVDFIKNQEIGNDYTARIEESIQNVASGSGSGDNNSDYDEYFVEAGRFVIEKQKGSIGMLQRVFKIGFNRAARIMDQLEEAGVVGPEEGTKPRRIIMNKEEFESYIAK